MVGIWLITTYNGLVKKQEKVNVMWSEVQNAYQRRLDLIPNLVNTVKGGADFEQTTLQQIAEGLNEKERNISQAINTIEKRNVNDYINNFRIEHACTLLLGDKDKPVFEVMYESGFSTKGAFNLAFKRVTGKTPTQYRSESK